ncbi:MAG TPA: YfhO family protein, partial [Thermoanaerobaculia bacterium]|nr:YfhO family protein [Thermoanaerobaculia bacterium]
MPAIVLYLATCAALIWLWHRHVQTVSLTAALVVILLPFVFTGKALLTGRVYAPIDLPYMSEPLKDYAKDYGTADVHNGALSDLYMQMIPWQSAVRQSFFNGEWPLWNPYLLCGNILAANMQSTVYDPLHLLALVLSHPQALTFNAAMTFFLCAFFTYAFARALGLGEVPSFVAAAAYMYSGMLAFFIAWPLGRAWTLLPLVLFAVRMVVRERSLRGGVLLATAFVMLIVAGHPESILHIVFLGAVYGLYELWSHRSWKAVGIAVAAGVVALGLTAVSLLPFWTSARETVEFGVRQTMYADVPFQIPQELVTKRIRHSLVPFWGGQPQRDNYNEQWEATTLRTGSVALALALASLLLARRRDTWFFAVVAVFCIFGGLNAWPVAHLLHALPLFDITINERLAFAAAFALSILAAIAVNAWPESRGKRWGSAALVLALAIGLGVLSHFLAMEQLAAGVKGELIREITLAELVPLLAVALLLAFRIRPRVAVPVVLALVLVQRTIVDGNIYPAIPQRAFYPAIPVLEQMQKDESGPFRMAGLHYAFLPDAAALYGLEDARGYEAMTNRRLFETYRVWSIHQGVSFNRISDRTPPFLSFLNIKYAIGSLDAQPDEQWKLVLEDRQSRLLENTRVLPRAFVPRWVRYEKEPNGVLLTMINTTDFAEKAVITAPEYEPHEVANGPGTLVLRRAGHSHAWDIDAKMEGDGWVVISDTNWPGWRVYIDGKRVETRFANHAFIGAFV